MKEILRDVDGVTPSRISSIATELSEIDKTAVIQKDRKGNPLVDPTTKDTEIIKLNQNVEEYMKEEVLPHVPDAIWRYEYDPNKAESSSNRERLGAEFPFTRYFYEYEQPRQSEDVLQEFFLLENELSKKIEDLRRIMKS